MVRCMASISAGLQDRQGRVQQLAESRIEAVSWAALVEVDQMQRTRQEFVDSVDVPLHRLVGRQCRPICPDQFHQRRGVEASDARRPLRQMEGPSLQHRPGCTAE